MRWRILSSDLLLIRDDPYRLIDLTVYYASHGSFERVIYILFYQYFNMKIKALQNPKKGKAEKMPNWVTYSTIHVTALLTYPQPNI